MENNKKTKTILVIEGTNRQDCQSIKVAKFIVRVGNKIDGVEAILVDPNDLKITEDAKGTDEGNTRYKELVKKADGFFMVIPEYNHSFPASLKRIVDSEYPNYFQKPVAMAGVSSGPWGGTRAIESFLHVAKAVGMLMIRKDIHFPHVGKLFDHKDQITEDEFVERVEETFEELLGLVERLG